MTRGLKDTVKAVFADGLNVTLIDPMTRGLKVLFLAVIRLKLFGYTD